MRYRATIILCLLLSGARSAAHSANAALQPGLSTRMEVERILGPAVRDVSETLSEYKSNVTPTDKVFVQYRRGSAIVERLEMVSASPADRALVVRGLNLAPQPTAAQTNAKGRLEEYFETGYVVLTYVGADATTGVSRVGYYSRELFEAATAKLPASPRRPSAAAGAGPAVSARPAGTASRYLGCFKDPNNPFDLDGYLERSAANTPQRCVRLCREKGFAYAGVQYGQSCLCGNGYGKFGVADNCNYPCTGDAGQMCGGYNSNSVYSTGGE
jgi:WSC domain